MASWTCKGCSANITSINILHCSTCHGSYLGDDNFYAHRKKGCRDVRELRIWRQLAQEVLVEEQKEDPAT